MRELKTTDFMNYEDGKMTPEEKVAFFQKLIDSEMAWTLQGMYGRTAEALIEQGLCTPQKVLRTV